MGSAACHSTFSSAGHYPFTTDKTNNIIYNLNF